MNSCFIRPAWPNGNFSIKARASLSEVTFKKKTGPVCVWQIHHWSILPARYSRSVAGTSLGKSSFICSGVGGFVNCPIARIFVVGTTGKMLLGISFGVGRLVLNVIHVQLLPSIRGASHLYGPLICSLSGYTRSASLPRRHPSILFSFHPFANI